MPAIDRDPDQADIRTMLADLAREGIALEADMPTTIMDEPGSITKRNERRYPEFLEAQRCLGLSTPYGGRLEDARCLA